MAIRNRFPELWQGGAFNPFREMSRLQRSVDRLFENVIPSSYLESSAVEAEFLPPIDVEETSDQYLVKCDLPGVAKDDVKIEMRGNQLLISGERKQEIRKEGGARLNVERVYGSFQRSLTLPVDVEAEKIQAAYHHGVLEIALPKSEAVKPRQIEIKETAPVQGKLIAKEKEKAGKAA